MNLKNGHQKGVNKKGMCLKRRRKLDYVLIKNYANHELGSTVNMIGRGDQPILTT
jgi:hypothetical protein